MFDLDGTLVDTIPGYFRLMEDILITVGLPLAPKSMVSQFLTDGLEVLKQMIPPEMAHRREELIRECIAVGRKKSASMFRNKVRLFPGVEKVFDLFTRLKIPMGVVTSTERENIARKMIPLERAGIAQALSAVIAIEDAPRRKPAPDPLLVCAERLAKEPNCCIYVGDAHVDIRAGKAAGMMTAGVLTGLADRETLMKEKATLILNSVAELYPLFARSI